MSTPVSALVRHEEPNDNSHDRARFDCGNEALNRFLHQHARKTHERAAAKTFVAINDDDAPDVGKLARILGFYSP